MKHKYIYVIQIYTMRQTLEKNIINHTNKIMTEKEKETVSLPENAF